VLVGATLNLTGSGSTSTDGSHSHGLPDDSFITSTFSGGAHTHSIFLGTYSGSGLTTPALSGVTATSASHVHPIVNESRVTDLAGAHGHSASVSGSRSYSGSELTPFLGLAGSFTISTPARDTNFGGSHTHLYWAEDEGFFGTDSYTTSTGPAGDHDHSFTPQWSGNLTFTYDERPTNISLSSAIVAENAAAGTVVGTLSGTGANLTYTPDPDYHGPDSFTFKVNDGEFDSNVATVSINVAPVNDAPVAAADAAATDEDTTAVGNVLANDSDVDDDTLSVSLVTGPVYGSLTLNADGSFTYTPGAHYNGSDSFTYQVDDGNGDTAEATATITITPVADAPVAADDAAEVAEDGSVAVAVLDNDRDADNLTGPANTGLTVTAVSQGAHGVVAIADSGVTYTPAPDYYGADEFTYTVSDPTGRSSTATVRVIVTPVNDAPTADPVADQTAEGSTGAFDVTLTGLTAGTRSPSGPSTRKIIPTRLPSSSPGRSIRRPRSQRRRCPGWRGATAGIAAA
jgi:VCBS repeat-containing protein